MHYLLIIGMTCLGHWDEFFMGECTSVQYYTLDKIYGESWYWLLGNHDFIKLLCCMEP